MRAPKEATAIRSDRNGIQVIARAAAVLRALRDNPEGLSRGELAKLLYLPRSTIQRIVDALDEENLVIAASPTRGVRLGPALLPLAAAARFEVVELARATLLEISRECGETVDLSLLDGNKVVFVDQIVGPHLLKAESAVGVSFPVYSTAPGKAMLAILQDAEVAAIRASVKLKRLTANTARTWAALESEIAAVRKRGIAEDIEENSIGICAIARALRLPTGELAAISVPVPTQRFHNIRADLERSLTEHWLKLHRAIGADRAR